MVSTSQSLHTTHNRTATSLSRMKLLPSRALPSSPLLSLKLLNLFQNGEPFITNRSPVYMSLRQLQGQAVNMSTGLSLKSPVCSRREKKEPHAVYNSSLL